MVLLPIEIGLILSIMQALHLHLDSFPGSCSGSAHQGNLAHRIPFLSVHLNEKCVSFEEQQLKEILMTARASTEKDKKITITGKTKGLC